jgi:hypothetical protein
MVTPRSRLLLRRCHFQKLSNTLLIFAILLSTVLAALPQPTYAAPAPRPAAAMDAALTIVEVSAPDINCIFDADCTITVDDMASHFVPPAASGNAFLQSRLWPVGEKGTAGAGLYAYLYRIDLRNTRGITAAACVTTMEIDFGPVASLDYNGDGKPDHVFVVTKGGLGNIKPVAATQSGGAITFRFDPAVCVGGRTGDSSFFFGLASSSPADLTQAHLTGTAGLDHNLQAKAPRRPGADIKEQPQFQILQADNTVFEAALLLPAVQSWTVKGPDDTRYLELALPGVDMEGENPGQPSVPIVRRIIAIPEGAEVLVSDVRVRASRHITDVIVYPTQPEPVDLPLSQEPSDDEMPPPETFMDAKFTIDEEAYASRANFPAQIVSVEHLGKMRDLNLVQVSVAAGQFNPAMRTLQLFDRVQFTIQFEGGKAGFLPRENIGNPFDNHKTSLYELALNYQIIEKFPFPGDFINRLCWGHEYLIITDPAFRPAADTLRTWKIQKGISTLVVETGNGSGQAGTTPTAIQSYIRNKFNTCIVRPSYVLLLGDAEHIAPFYRTTHYGDSAGTDLDYALMDNADILPDLAVGRIPVDTLDDANIVVNKIVSYEQSPPFAPSFYRSTGFASYFQCCRDDVTDDGRTVRSFIETAELVRNELTGLGYSVDRLYSTSTSYHPDYAAAGRDTTPRRYRNGANLPAAIGPGSGFGWNATSADVIDTFNAGRFLMLHRGHGGVNGWGSPSFSSTHLNSLTNGNRLPVVYSINCASGLFDNETLDPNAQDWNYNTTVNGVYWAERILRMEGGAVGVIGDTRNSPTWANSALARGLFDATWPGVVPEGGANSIRRLGDILNYGKLYMAGQVGVAQTAGSVAQNAANTNLILYHVYGDPTLQMWVNNPWFVRLPLLYEVLKFEPNIWSIRYPLDGAVITLLQEGNPVARATVRNGVANLPFIGEFDSDKGYDISASVPGGMSTLLESSQRTGNVTPEQGGSVEDEAGRIKVQFPAGAVQRKTTIFLADVTRESNLEKGQMRRFVLEGLNEDGELVDTFDAAYKMELAYTDEELRNANLDESSLQCTWFDETENVWKPVQSTVDAANKIVTCQADHFTQFALAGETVQAGHSVFLPLLKR